MTPEQVTSHLKEVMNEVTTYIPEKFFKENLFFAGGALRSLVNDETPKDYDIFCRSDEAAIELKEFLKDKWRYESNNSIGLFPDSGKEIQFITCSTGSPEKIIGEFDFTMNMNYYDPNDLISIIHYSAYDKKLYINPKARNVLGTLARISKFVARGFEVPNATDLVTLGIRASKMEPITKTSQLVEHCRMASCVSDIVIINNELERDYDINSLEINLRGSGA